MDNLFKQLDKIKPLRLVEYRWVHLFFLFVVIAFSCILVLFFSNVYIKIFGLILGGLCISIYTLLEFYNCLIPKDIKVVIEHDKTQVEQIISFEKSDLKSALEYYKRVFDRYEATILPIPLAAFAVALLGIFFTVLKLFHPDITTSIDLASNMGTYVILFGSTFIFLILLLDYILRRIISPKYQYQIDILELAILQKETEETAKKIKKKRIYFF